MDELLEQISNYLEKAEAALDAGEIEKAGVFTDMAQIVVDLTNTRGPAMHVLRGRGRGVGRRPGVVPGPPFEPPTPPTPTPPTPPTPGRSVPVEAEGDE